MKTIAIEIIKIYKRFISPFIGPTCRYYPTCSSYAMQAIEKYGFFKGSYMATERILRCHPFSPGGYDPVK